MNLEFRPQQYFRYKGADWKFVKRTDGVNGTLNTNGIYKGEDLMKIADNGFRYEDFEQILLRRDYTTEQIDDAIGCLTMEECFAVIPNPSDFGDSYHIHVGNCRDVYHMFTIRPSFNHSTKWYVGISDWFGSKDQVEFFSTEGENLLECLQKVVSYCCKRGMLPQERFDRIILPRINK